MKPTAILSMDIRYHKTGMETRANPVLFDMPDFEVPKSKLFGKRICTRKPTSKCGESSHFEVYNHKSLPVSRKAFVVSNNGRIYIGRGVG